MTLNDYMKKNIFEPLDITDMSMIPTAEMKAKLAYMHHRSPDGALHPRDHLMRTPLIVRGTEETARCFNSGGGGLFARPQEYCSKSHQNWCISSFVSFPSLLAHSHPPMPEAGLALCQRQRQTLK